MQELAKAGNQQKPPEQNQNGSELPKNEDMIPEIGVKMIRNGDKGNMVKLAQSCLSCLGFSVSIDGIFGNEFEKKIREFQGNKHLETDGIVGNETWKYLLDIPYLN
jgi:peptidoglycan hydrolase-like protein with peptidoglycan-binding domain